MKTRLLLLLALLVLAFGGHGIVAAQDGDSTFPITIEHKFGTTTITEAPERIVVLGFTEQDPFYALGVQPVGIRYWYGDENDAIFPWAEDEAGDTEPVVLNMPYGNLNYEAILELQPDLISAIDAGITAEEYETLSEIAPTVAQYDTYVDFGMPWQETTRLIGMSLGMTEEAEALVNETEALLEDVRATYPAFEGQTIAVAYNAAGTYGYYTGQDSRGRFFTDLGFVVPDELNEIAGDSFYADISTERIDLLDQDLLVFLALQFFEGGSEAAREAIESDILLNQLTVMRDERVFLVDDAYDSALQFSTVLALEYLLEEMVPELAATLGIEPTMTDMAAMDDCDDGLRGVEDAAGETICIPEEPQRVVALQEGDIDGLVALGVQPVGATNGRGQATPPRYLNDGLGEDVVSTGQFFQPNVEVILELDPDLILFAGFSDPTVLEQLNAIAPVFNTATFAEDWRTQFGRVADAMNLQAEGEAFLAAYDARVAELNEALAATGESPQFIVARWSVDGPQIMAPTTFSSRILLDVGMTALDEIPELQEGHPHSAPLSLESIGLLDVDWAFVGTLQGQGDAVAVLDDVLENPLFQSLQVVQNEHLVVIDGSLWTSVGGPLAAMAVLNTVEDAILGME